MARKKIVEKKSAEKPDTKSKRTNGEANSVDQTSKTKNSSLKKKTKVEEGEDAVVSAAAPRGKKRKVETKEVGGKEEAAQPSSDSEVAEKKVKKKRKTKKERTVEAMPLAPRTNGHRLFIGAHVSASGGVQNSIGNSVHIGGNAFALFLKSQRKWANPPLAADQCTSFHANCKSHSYDQGSHVVPHGSYLVNLAHTDKARTEQAFESFLDDLKRCERLGIKLYNFHPGVANSTNGDRQAAIAHLASNINRAHKATSTVVTLLENMAAGGNVLGSTFEDLRDTIALINDKTRVGVCLDTCHAFAGGYDLRMPAAYKATMDQFEEVVGFQYLRAVHMNDSKAPFASHRDLHANIGTGFVGLRGFHNIVNDTRFEGLPLILETPLDSKDENGAPLKDDKGKPKSDSGIWAREIKLLESLVGMNTESEEFLATEKALAKKGEAERKKMNEQMDKKREKEEKKKARAEKKAANGTTTKKKGKKKVETESEAEDSDLSEGESDSEGGAEGDTQRIVS